MLDRFCVKNFKAFKKADITIRPLTIIVGPNNSGKSTLLQSINLIQQTLLRNARNHILNMGNQVSSGDQLIDFGNFSEIMNQSIYYAKSRLADEKKIEFKLFFGENDIEFSLRDDENSKIYIDNFALNTHDIEYSIKDLSVKDYYEKDFNIKNSEKFNINLDKLNVISESNFKKDNSKLIFKVQPNIKREGFFSELLRLNQMKKE